MVPRENIVRNDILCKSAYSAAVKCVPENPVAVMRDPTVTSDMDESASKDNKRFWVAALWCKFT